MKCPICGSEFKPKGLAIHQAKRHRADGEVTLDLDVLVEQITVAILDQRPDGWFSYDEAEARARDVITRATVPA